MAFLCLCEVMPRVNKHILTHGVGLRGVMFDSTGSCAYWHILGELSIIVEGSILHWGHHVIEWPVTGWHIVTIVVVQITDRTLKVHVIGNQRAKRFIFLQTIP